MLEAKKVEEGNDLNTTLSGNVQNTFISFVIPIILNLSIIGTF